MTKISRKLRGLVLLPPCALLFFIGAVTVQAAPYYVATTGTDASPGTLSQPFRTIVRGVRALQAGDTLYIRAGTYVERLHSSKGLVWPNGDSWSNPVTIAAYQGESVTLRPGPGGSVIALDRPDQASHYIIFDGLILDAINTDSEAAVGIMESANHIRFQNCEIKNSWSSGVMVGWGPSGFTSDYNEFINCTIHHSGRDGSNQISGVNIPGPNTQPGLGRGHGFYIETSHNLVRNCVIHSNGEYGLKFYYGNPDSGRRANDNTVRDSILYRNGYNTTRYGHPIGGGILLAAGKNNRAINNIIYNNNDIYLHGIDTGYTATDSLIYNNTIYNVGLGIQVTATSTNAIIKNNIIYLTTNIPTDDRGVGTTWTNNLIQINPQFVDVAAGNFRLLSTSPAIDRGAPLTEVTKDIAGVSRPQGTAHEIGAYEVGTGSDSAAPSAPRGLIIN